MGEAAFDETCHMEIDEFVDALEEGEDFSICLKEVYDGLVKSCERLVLFVTTRVVGAAAVKHIATSVAGFIGWDAFLEGEGEDIDMKKTLSPTLSRNGEGGLGNVGGIVLQIGGDLGFLGIFGSLTLFLLLVLNDEGLSDFFQVGIGIAGA